MNSFYKPELICLQTVKCFQVLYLTLAILLDMIYLFVH